MNDNHSFYGRRTSLHFNRHKFGRKNYHFEHPGTPYAMGPRWKRKRYSDEDTVWEDNKVESELGLVAENGTLGSWFKVTIPNGRNYDKTWLMNSMQDLCSVAFIPVDFHYDKHQARFFVQNARTAYALKDINNKLCDETNQKISIFISPSVVPYSVQSKFTSEEIEQLKVTVMKRYDASQKSLDLERFRFDKDFMDNDIDVMLNRRSCMVATLQIIQSSIPELLALNLCNNKLYQLDGLSDMIEKTPQVKILNLSKNKLKTVWELEKVKELNLEELWLEGNPFCSHFSDQSDYISAIRDLFPKLLRLDGKELIVPTGMDTEVPQLSKQTCTETEPIKNLVLRFLKEYYSFYDNGERYHLLDAYHDEACFSLTVSSNFNDPDLSNLEEYFKHNRDIKKIQDSYMRMRLLRHTKHTIVDSLSLLPKTQHDLCSFLVDLCFHTETVLCFSVNGLFKEVEGKYQGYIRAFTRIFITTHYNNSRICIMNDKLIVRNTSLREIQNAFVPANSPFLKSSKKWCLEDNGWNYAKAAEIFTMLQNESKIPKEFFE